MITKEALWHAFYLDEATGKLFWRNPPKQHAERVGREAGFICKAKGKNKDYWHIRISGKTFKRSRVVFMMVHGHWPEPAVDHINGNSLDDRPENLRQCTLSQNTVNSRDKARKYDLPRGVSKTKQGKFMARLSVGGVSKSLGVYDTPAEASRVFQAARKEVHREFA